MDFNWEDVVRSSDAARFAPAAADVLIARTLEEMKEKEEEKDA